ncbi:DUF3231 family protein [Halobacillus shinanisalinarum]|uniref:DUF3231 family protein n=1 Tax=Halobacillus shinanisalinarum TaxID=2932258 RepID=A0ABY4GU33_9BACI|nr:DUF3231 family protein [Halobacillus shinanisalinarum]UOQ91534.1 DUF3231 family protein [Halobacillus shinanisalinarum]
METTHNAKLTAAELSQLWSAYINDTLITCEATYYLQIIEDPQIRELMSLTLQEAEGHIKKLTAIFNDNQYPLPKGFTKEEDVNVNAPRLFSDVYILNWLSQFAKLGLNAYSVSVEVVTREDIQSYFSECLSQSNELIRKSNEVLLSKGLYMRPPSLPTPDGIDFVKSQEFLAGWFGDVRPLTSLEITNLYTNIQRNALGIVTMQAFVQTAKSKETVRYFKRGKQIAGKHVEVFSSTMQKDDLPAPMTWDAEVTDSTSQVFSDKLMMYKGTFLTGISLGYYGASMAASPRRDLGAMYVRLMAEIGKYAEDGANIMIKNGWMEEPPRAADRDELAKKKG